MTRIFIMGAGGMGTAMAVMLSNAGKEVTLWGHRTEHVEQLLKSRENTRLLKGIKIPKQVTLTTELSALREAELLILATPSAAVRQSLEAAAPFISPKAVIACVSKGLEAGSLLPLHEVAGQVLPQNSFVALSGPSHAEELSRGIPTVLVAASGEQRAAKQVQSLFEGTHVRVYTSGDVIGVELCGALKNIIAFAAGVLDGMGGGDNAKAALMTRGLTEMARLGVSLGARSETFAGISGIGDLIVTCCSMHSRNRRCGILVGQGKSADDAVKEIGMIVEGVFAARCAYLLAQKLNVEMPITRQVCLLIDGKTTAKDAMSALLERPQREEIDSSWLNE